MKILAIGDFHGKFPEKLRKRIKKEKPDLIISVGDYFPWSMKKEFFKYCYKRSCNLWDVLGKKKFKKNTLEDLKKGEKTVIEKLNSLGLVITVIGNYDHKTINDQYPSENWREEWKWVRQDFFSKIIKKYKNIKRFDYKYAKFGGLIFIGGYGHSSPGRVKSRAYQKHKRKLDNLFKKFRKENKEGRVIFVFHNMPYNCKLDKIRDKEAPKESYGRHYGSKLIRRIINKHKPILGIGGHMHENQGKIKIGKTTVINTGAVMEGKAALIEFDDKKGKVRRVGFIK
jgi:Icc-related predicted phosphoesterase